MDSSRSIFWLLLLFILKIVGAFSYGLDSLDASSPCPIYLTISPISRHADDAFLEINWGPRCPNPPDLIGMYGDNPSISYVEPLYKVKPSGDPTGHVKTSVKFGKLHLLNGWKRNETESKASEALSTPICLPFWIASFIENKQQTIDCLKLNPTWMSSIQQIQNVSLKHLFLPGTHCSGCYEQQNLNSNVLLLKKFGFAQNVDIWTQLVFGIRFLDMSIGYMENKPNSTDVDNFWIVNENLFIAPLTQILKDVRLFVQRSNDIVIIDFGDFPIGFNHNQTCHSLFIEYLENELGDIAFRHSPNDTLESGDLTIEMMHNQSKPLLILYNDERSTVENDLIWFSWRKFSTQNLQSDEITEYVQKIFSKKFQNSPVDVPWIVHGIQGISSSYSQAHSHLPTSRQRADGINRIFSDLISNAWSLNANVVAFDFFLSCNLIDIAINANILKHSNNTDHVIINIDQ